MYCYQDKDDRIVLANTRRVIHFSHLYFCYCVWIWTVDEKELKELKIQREEREQFHRDEQCKTANLLEEKGEFFLTIDFRIHLPFNSQEVSRVEEKITTE